MQTTIRVTEELYQKIKDKAKEKGLSVNAEIITALWKHIKEAEGGEKDD